MTWFEVRCKPDCDGNCEGETVELPSRDVVVAAVGSSKRLAHRLSDRLRLYSSFYPVAESFLVPDLRSLKELLVPKPTGILHLLGAWDPMDSETLLGACWDAGTGLVVFDEGVAPEDLVLEKPEQGCTAYAFLTQDADLDAFVMRLAVGAGLEGAWLASGGRPDRLVMGCRLCAFALLRNGPG